MNKADLTRHAFARDGILLRSIVITLLACVLVGLTTVAYTSRELRLKTAEASATRLSQLLDTVESTVSVACFVKDEQLALELARGLMNNSEVYRVQIIEGRQVLADVGKTASLSADQPMSEPIHRAVHSPFDTGEEIGRIVLTPDPYAIEHLIRAEVSGAALRLAWQLMLIALVVAGTLYLFVVRPITTMSRHLHRMNPAAGDRLPVPPGHGGTEIGHLASDINQLAGRLVEALEEEHVLRLKREVDEKKFHAIFDNAESGIFLVDQEYHLLSWNPAFSRLFGLSEEAIQPGLDTLGWEQPGQLTRMLADTLAGNQTSQRDFRVVRSPAGERWLRLSLSPVGDELLQGVVHDVSELKAAESSALRKAMTDPLTGLANRSSLESKLEELCQQSNAGGAPLFALLLIDLDKFRQVTEGVGVSAGDHILRVTAERLSGSVKRSDTVARLSADIFAIALCNISHGDKVDRIVERILRRLRQPYLVDGSPIILGASIGIALFPNDGEQAGDMLRHAELAGDKAKKAGGNQAVFFDARLAEIAEQRRQLDNDLRTALREQQFELFYQPIVDLPGNDLAGAESLIRWRHPVRGLVPPDQFIPILEQTGMIVEVGLWILDTACAQLAEWMQAGKPYYLSINVSGKQIPDGLRPEQVAECLQRHGVPAEHLALEITEGVLLEDVEAAQGWLRAMRELGVHLYLDDFGTGYSSLSYLKRFPLDTLKIDRAFILDMDQGNNERSLVEAIIAMAGSLDLRVVAEGVESATHFGLLRDLGCQYAQGYYLSRPVPAAEFTATALRIEKLLAQAASAPLEVI